MPLIPLLVYRLATIAAESIDHRQIPTMGLGRVVINDETLNWASMTTPALVNQARGWNYFVARRLVLMVHSP